MHVFTDKLLNLCTSHSEQIARAWCKAVKTNPRTPSFASIPDDDLVSEAVHFYKKLKDVFFSADRFQMLQKHFGHLAERTFNRDIELHEGLYALAMMKRHIWLYAEFQTLFNTGLDMYHAVESINRMVLIFDYANYAVTLKYRELEAEKECM